MCVNYLTATPDQLHAIFRAEGDLPPYEPEAWPKAAAPCIVRQDNERIARLACFGLIPSWAVDSKVSYDTMNARAETVAVKPSYRSAWSRKQFCLIPARALFEPNYESGKSVRWRIERNDREPFAIAGIWSTWTSKSGSTIWSFAMLTVNADAHPLMRRFHAPGKEKRSVVIIEPSDYDAWLSADTEIAKGLLRIPDENALTTEPDPLPPTRRKTKSDQASPSAVQRALKLDE